MNILSRILSNEVTDDEVRAHVISFMLRIAGSMAAAPHDPNGCKVKNCVHGNQQLTDRIIAHAAQIHSEMGLPLNGARE